MSNTTHKSYEQEYHPHQGDVAAEAPERQGDVAAEAPERQGDVAAEAPEHQGDTPQLQPSDKGDDKVLRMGTASIPRLIFEFAVPSVVGMLINGSYGIIDSIFLGHAVGEIGLSAITVANPIMVVFMALAMLIGNGGNSLAALRLGEGKREDAEHALGNVVTMSVIASVIVFLLGWLPGVSDAILDLASATPEVRPYAQVFIQVICAGFFLQCIGLGVNNFIRTCGAPNRALGSMVVGLVGAVIFNFLLVIVLDWGVLGSAVATVLGWACSCVAVLQYFCFKKDVPLRLRVKYLPLVGAMDKTILAFGLPSFCVQAGMAVVNFVINYQLVKYGAMSPIGSDDALAAIGVVQRITQFAVMPLIGISIALQPLLGFNYGARNVGRVVRTLWVGIAAATVFAIVMFIPVEVFSTPIAHAFGITSAQLADFTAFAIRIQFLMFPFVGFQIVSSNYFQATGQPAKSVFLTLTRQILFLIPMLFIMPEILPVIAAQFNGLDALYFAAPVADFLAIFTTAIFVFFEMRRLRRLNRVA
jgi:putative MATE family efflux protein